MLLILVAPSGFAMKLRKHLNNKRLEKINQLGADRIVDLQFGTDTFAHHVILELYDKGNILLTDHTYKILNLLRPRVDGEERLAAHETYAVDKAKQNFALDYTEILEIINGNPSPKNKTLRELFMSKVEFGPALFAHVLKLNQLTPQTKVSDFGTGDEGPLAAAMDEFTTKIHKAFEKGCEIIQDKSNVAGFILCTAPKEQAPDADSAPSANQFYDQFHPSVIIDDYDSSKVIPFESFDICVDEFFSKIESQKLDMKQLNQEKEAIKKLERVKLDQQKRLDELKVGQEVDRKKAELITTNQAIVDMAINAIRKLVASQIPWDTIDEQLKEARSTGDPLAGMISDLNLKQNSITLLLRDPYDYEGEEEPLKVSVDLNFSAYANATKYYDLKKQSAKKEERTLISQEKALKSTEKKTLASIKEAQNIHLIKKARKVLWFEKFKWFVTSENYLVLGGRDAQQNELLVKKYLRARDIYMHADSHGAPTVVILNDGPEGEVVPPKSLNEAATFSVCLSGSWESKVVTSCWWVNADQVSKSAPSGEYLPTGSFMIRGKKNYLPPCQLVLGFGFLFRVTEECVENHKNERMRRHLNSESEQSVAESEGVGEKEEEVEVKEEEEDGGDDEEEFPDTHVELDLAKGNKVRARLTSGASGGGGGEDDEYMITHAPVVHQSLQKLKNKQKKAGKEAKEKGKEAKERGKKGGGGGGAQRKISEGESIADPAEAQKTPAKRGHHGRKKKLKEKYKDQDEEERLIKMQLLRTGGISGGRGSGEGGDDNEEGAAVEVKEEDLDEEDNANEGSERGKAKGAKKADGGGDGEETAVEGAVGEVEEEELTATPEAQVDLLKTLTGKSIEKI